MRALLLLVLSIVLVNEPAFAQARFPFTAEAVADRANVRAGQHNNYEVVATLSKGALVTVLSKQYSWYKVALPQGAMAFVKAEHVKRLSPDLGEVLADRLNVRAAANAQSSILGQVMRGRKLFLREEKDGWLLIQPVDGLSAWVSESLLTFKSNSVARLPDPEDAAVRQEMAAREKQLREAKKTALLNRLSDGSVECHGVLNKELGAPVVFRVLRDQAVVCVVEGPQEALDRFSGSRVKVTGKIKSVPEGDAPVVVTLTRVKIDL